MLLRMIIYVTAHDYLLLHMIIYVTAYDYLLLHKIIYVTAHDYLCYCTWFNWLSSTLVGQVEYLYFNCGYVSFSAGRWTEGFN
jgi:hypothetical protein